MLFKVNKPYLFIIILTVRDTFFKYYTNLQKKTDSISKEKYKEYEAKLSDAENNLKNYKNREN